MRSIPTQVSAFDDDILGSDPASFTVASGQWHVVADSSAPSGGQVLAQQEANTGSSYNVVLPINS